MVPFFDVEFDLAVVVLAVAFVVELLIVVLVAVVGFALLRTLLSVMKLKL